MPRNSIVHSQKYFLNQGCQNIIMHPRYIPHSYLRQQLRNNILRIKLLSELQSQLTIKDYTNTELKDRLFSLQSENGLLKQRLQERQKSSSTSGYYLNGSQIGKDRAIDRANQVLLRKKSGINYTTPNSGRKQSHYSSQYQPLQTAKYGGRSHSFQNTGYNSPQQEIRLSKEVYFDGPGRPNYLSRTDPKPPTLHRKQISFRKDVNEIQNIDRLQPASTPFQLEQSQPPIQERAPSPSARVKFTTQPKSIDNSEIKKLEHFDQSQSKLIENSQSVPWNSNVNLKSQIYSKMNNSDMKRKKNYLSVVSASSKSKSRKF